MKSPNTARGCVKCQNMSFQKSKYCPRAEFSHSLSPEPAPVGACRSAIAVQVASRRWLPTSLLQSYDAASSFWALAYHMRCTLLLMLMLTADCLAGPATDIKIYI